MDPHRYKSCLVQFMSYRDGKRYDKDSVFTQAQLLSIVPEDLCKWFNYRAYHSSSPDESMKPVHARASSIEFAKKAISSFMPRQRVTWDSVRQEGNPTRSDEVNKLIKKIKKSEVRKEGAPTSTRRPIEYDEYMSMLTLLHGPTSKQHTRYKVSSILTMQWHLMARIDDMIKLKFANLSPSDHDNGTITCQMRWSKNITEERDAPTQIVFGSLDPRVCPLLNLAIYIETTTSIASSDFVFGNPNDGDRVVRRVLSGLLKDERFQSAKSGGIGTHSLRKGAATYASRCGVPREYINRRGRWRTRKAVVDIYIDNTLPYPDAVAASALAGPLGPCCYKLKSGIQNVTDQFLVGSVGPSTRSVLGDPIAKTLARSLLWASLLPPDSFECEVLPASLAERIRSEYVRHGGNPSLNPIERVPLHVAGQGDQLQLIELRDSVDDVASTETTTSIGSSARELTAVHAQFFSLKRQMTDLMNELLRTKTEMQRQHQRTCQALKRIALQPVTRPVQLLATDDAQEPVHPSQTLSQRPSNLYELWHEYEFGLNGQKPAKEYTSSERGANKFAYSRRKVFWDTVSGLVRAGFTSDVAIDKVYAVYGSQTSVTAILTSLRHDRSHGGHPSLTV